MTFIANATILESDLTLDYADRTIAFASSVEVSRSDAFSVLLESGDTVVPGETLYARLASNPDAVLTYVVPQPEAPAGISLTERTTTAISVTEITGVEYKLSTETEVGTWQDGAAFTELTVGTAYTLHARFKATAEAFESAEFTLSVSTIGIKPTPTAADVTVNYANLTITFTGLQVSRVSGSWTAANLVANNGAVTPGATLYVRAPADENNNQSAVFTLVLPARPAAPTVTSTVTADSITLTAPAGTEFKLADGQWVDTAEFTGLAAETEYTFTVRLKSTASAFASEEATVKATTEKAPGVPGGGGCGGAVTAGTMLSILGALALVAVFKRKKIA
jgi:hypothetical protein